MDYPFPPVPYKIYSKTFLKDVHLVFKYATVHPDETVLANVRHYYEKSFRITTQNVDVTDDINIKSKDELIWFDFKWDELSICMKSPMYKSFELTLEVMEYALDFFKAIGVVDVEKVVFYKFNELSYNLAKDVAVSEIMEQIFSKELLENMSSEDIDTQKGLSRWEKIVNYPDNTSNFTIEFGFNRNAKESNTGSLTLKTQIESNLALLHVDDIENLLREYNQILDNAFHWCVRPEIINKMK